MKFLLLFAQFFVLMDWIFGTLRVPDKEKFA
jgi:sterol desaturase/sphingolipid hydroxylase (fatty acid hydroxylase superfamily)